MPPRPKRDRRHNGQTLFGHRFDLLRRHRHTLAGLNCVIIEKSTRGEHAGDIDGREQNHEDREIDVGGGRSGEECVDTDGTKGREAGDGGGGKSGGYRQW